MTDLRELFEEVWDREWVLDIIRDCLVMTAEHFPEKAEELEERMKEIEDMEPDEFKERVWEIFRFYGDDVKGEECASYHLGEVAELIARSEANDVLGRTWWETDWGLWEAWDEYCGGDEYE